MTGRGEDGSGAWRRERGLRAVKRSAEHWQGCTKKVRRQGWMGFSTEIRPGRGEERRGGVEGMKGAFSQERAGR